MSEVKVITSNSASDIQSHINSALRDGFTLVAPVLAVQNRDNSMWPHTYYITLTKG